MLTNEDYDEIQETLQQLDRVLVRHAKNRDDEILTVRLRVAKLKNFVAGLALKATKRKISASAVAKPKRKTRKH